MNFFASLIYCISMLTNYIFILHNAKFFILFTYSSNGLCRSLLIKLEWIVSLPQCIALCCWFVSMIRNCPQKLRRCLNRLQWGGPTWELRYQWQNNVSDLGLKIKRIVLQRFLLQPLFFKDFWFRMSLSFLISVYQNNLNVSYL